MKTIRKTGIWLVLMITTLAIVLSACSSGSQQNASNNNSNTQNTAQPEASPSEKPAPKVKVVVGGKDFTEQRILSAITSITPLIRP